MTENTLAVSVPIIIEDVNIKQDEYGRFCLNDLHKAAGGQEKHKPTRWVRNQQTQEIVEKLSRDQIWSQVDKSPIQSVNGGNNPGTYVCKELVYSYAMWINADFHIKVVQTFDALVTGQIKTNQSALPNITNPAEAARAWADEYDGRLLAEQKVTELQPKADFVDEYVDAKGNMTLKAATQLVVQKLNSFNSRSLSVEVTTECTGRLTIRH
ncbi:KilA-N domain-containing protein [Spartinivicinus poritis]|uniref:KilA-N domain-containing protein n=1 Tax=Spartinivicinus poritis TaxID=2994640 RepID=A0ABT5UGT2_9GAMM|nr:KilA-N domain-containing protein [Spartinivicinus sp. A2-2]MDE1465420.1 KilA-N domain-containing protein [Spartinivicinus sp. A2-2]